MIARGAKVGCLFCLDSLFSSYPMLPYVACNFAHVDYQTWHKRLELPNKLVLFDLLKYGLLGNKKRHLLRIINLNVVLVNSAKEKIYLFQLIHPT